MKTVRPSNEQLGAFMTGDHDHKPVAMLNMLKFRERANYTSEHLHNHPEAANLTGQEAYEIYSRQTMPFMFAVGGQLLWMGDMV